MDPSQRQKNSTEDAKMTLKVEDTFNIVLMEDHLRRQPLILKPGDRVSHRLDNGIGMVIATGDKKTTILWSVEPFDPSLIKVQVQPILASTRKLQAKWSCETSEDLNAFYGMLKP